MRIKSKYRVPFETIVSESTDAVEIKDSDLTNIKTGFLSRQIKARDPNPIAAKLLNQFLKINRSTFQEFGLDARPLYTGDELILQIRSSVKIGAMPLVSPITFKPDYGLIIKPRFGWNGIGPLLSTTGWRILPRILDLPQLKISERKVPPWVLSSIVLRRIDALLKQLDRRFEYTEQDLSSPKGTINWPIYATERITKAGFLKIPCRFPDLKDNIQIKSAIHYTLLRQRHSLETQREFGYYVLQLLDFCNSLIRKVMNFAPQRPINLTTFQYSRSGMTNQLYLDGIQAIDWTINEKGLAGLGDLNGIPWQMSMETLFETYIESLCAKVTNQIGGRVKSGRQRQTVTPINWEPPFLGSQKFLLPDLTIDNENGHIIVDAKYKDHWEDLNIDSWRNVEEEVQKRHRVDLFQVLAYASMIDVKRIKCCLIYPCSKETFASLFERKRLVHNATITSGQRRIDLKLTAVPFDIPNAEAVESLKNLLLN